MIRIFNQYIPSRALILLAGEVAIISGSFALAIVMQFGEGSSVMFHDSHTLWKIALIALLAFACSHFMELYDLQQLNRPNEMYTRVFVLVGALSLLLAALTYFFPGLILGRRVFLAGLCIMSLTWVLWRWTYIHVFFHPALLERVYVLGDGEHARRIVEAIRTRAELGMELVGWTGEEGEGPSNSESIAHTLRDLENLGAVKRVIVAMTNRRSVMPVNELLDLRLSGVRVEDGTTLLEKISGKIEIDELRPSWLIFRDGFRLAPRYWFWRRIVSTLLASTLSIITLPLIPIIVILIKLSSSGPVLYKQRRAGFRGQTFYCYKFRTMRADAEADSGPTWATDDDPRITKVGKILRRMRLDEIPQLWNILRGDMAFVGPRPERPEFVAQLSAVIPYYGLRHLTRPGLTGWAQINYGYGSSVEEAKEKLRYDLYYLRNVSVMLDLVIVFYTMRAVLIGRGVR